MSHEPAVSDPSSDTKSTSENAVLEQHSDEENGIDEALREYREMAQSREELQSVFRELQSTI